MPRGRRSANSLSTPQPTLDASLAKAVVAGGAVAFRLTLPDRGLTFLAGSGAELGLPRAAVSMADDMAGLLAPGEMERIEAAVAAHLRGEAEHFSLIVNARAEAGGFVRLKLQGQAAPPAQGESRADGEEGGTHEIIGLAIQVEDLHARGEALAQERDRWFSILDRLPAFVCLIGPDYTLRFANRWYRDTFGEPSPDVDLSTTAVLGPCRAVEGSGVPSTPIPTLDVFETGSLSIWEFYCEPLGKTFQIFDYPFRDDAGLLVLELGIDITQRKRAEDALAASEERSRSITDNLPLGLAVIEPDGVVASVNPKILEWFGPGEMDTTLARLLELDELGQGRTSLAKTLAEGAISSHTASARPLTADSAGRHHGPGLPREFVLTFCPIFSPRPESSEPLGAETTEETGPGVRAAIAMIEDVTEKRSAERSLARARKLESLGTLAAGIAHEINQPLNALQLYLSGLEMLAEKEGGLSHETLLTRLSWMLGETGKIRDIITHMRALVHQRETPTTSATDVSLAVTSALALVGAQLKAHGITLLLDLAPEMPLVKANPVQLEQVVINLVVNAMQALDTLGTSELAEKWVHVRAHPRATGEGVTLSVRDNGPGLPGAPGEAERLFDPFYTTKHPTGGPDPLVPGSERGEPAPGMGLGLSIVHTFVRSWGGEVRAANGSHGPPTPGAVFTITLSAHAEPDEPASGPSPDDATS